MDGDVRAFPSLSLMFVKGVPLHVWHEEVFCLIENCLGRTSMVDKEMIAEENLLSRRIKVLMNKPVTLPCLLALWVEELRLRKMAHPWSQIYMTMGCWGGRRWLEQKHTESVAIAKAV